MNRCIQILGVFIIVSINSFGQEELNDLLNNPSIKRNHQENEVELRSASQFVNPYFLMDTLSVPFIDDFSVNRLFKDNISAYSSASIKDSLAYNFKVNGEIVNEVKFMTDTSWTYSYNVSTSSLDSFPKPGFTIDIFDNYNEPFVASQSLTVWPEYYRHICDTLGNFEDSVYIDPNVIMTLTVDTIKVIDAFEGKALWMDYNVFINSNYPVSPPTIGVATFDGLKSNGRPYSPGQVLAQGEADVLTSKPVNLNIQVSDSVYLSFYYQPQGLGNAPDPEDSLYLEFYSPLDNLWHWQWSSQGGTLADFKRVNIPVNDSKFLQNGFKFRFKNYATLSGNLDHWHLDYVKLDKNRTYTDTLQNDVAFVSPSNVLLQQYTEMPWKQFTANPQAEMLDTLKVSMRNNSDQSKVVTYTYSIYDKNNNLLVTNGGLNGNEPPSNFSYSNKIGFTFPNSAELYEKFEVLNVISVPIIGDEISANDTIRHFQKFDHSFAYDDGTAEAAYGLNAYGSKMAYRFFLNTTDTLSAVAIHFAQVNIDASLYPFKLTVWSSLSPETIVYQSETFEYPVYENIIDGFHVYKIDPLVLPAGNFYVGMVQTSNVKLNVGFDKNTDASSNMFFNTDGSWANTQFQGSWLIRPVLGTPVLPVGIEEHNLKPGKDMKALDVIGFYPNPNNGMLNISGLTAETNVSLILYDMFGRALIEQNPIESKIVNLSKLPNGVYFIKLFDRNTGFSRATKIVLNK